MANIRISDEVKDAIKAIAVNDETADAVLRRLMGMDEAKNTHALVRSLGEWPFTKLGVSEKVTIPWPINPDTRLGDIVKSERIRRAVYRHQKKTGKNFHIMGTPMGLLITRVL